MKIFKTLFVTNLCYTTSEAKIREHFSQAGEVAEVRLITRRKYTGGKRILESKGYAFVDVEDPDKVIRELNEQELDGRRLLVKLAEKGKNETP